jgi:hypothetical protein
MAMQTTGNNDLDIMPGDTQFIQLLEQNLDSSLPEIRLFGGRMRYTDIVTRDGNLGLSTHPLGQWIMRYRRT